MLASITPLGERGRGGSWRRAATAYAIASVLGGAAMGAPLGALGGGLRTAAGPSADRWLVTGAGLAAAVAALADVTGRLPSIHRQVDERWLVTYRDWVYGAGFGLQLGFGAVTIVTSASLYLTWALELLAADPVWGLAIGATFGAVRALPLLAVGRVDDVTALRDRHRRLHGMLPAVARATVAVQATAAIALIGTAVAGGLTRGLLS